ncbi:hypothetical protein SAMN05444362_10720 [Dysgonomonas macrotermitis]|uniref:Uncharacterized protein n=1 Tax=Dysgonomonas macrotermitis TaxID=1346286 RepID=A0A1M5C3X3_9BACT|nr:hypothetical protein SAMN05444362_10720 [Dysgonomonas macrotermitis]
MNIDHDALNRRIDELTTFLCHANTRCKTVINLRLLYFTDKRHV